MPNRQSTREEAGQRLTRRRRALRFVEVRRVDASPEALFDSFSTLGGERGWLAWNWLWRFRGLLDELVGGPGLRRGRRDPVRLAIGETVDFWVVEAMDPPRMLRLRAEMKVPGPAWLQWETHEDGQGTRLTQTALFEPQGLPGRLYWYSLYPIHLLIFPALIEAIAASATERQRPDGT